MRLSVIVPVLNDADELGRLLPKLWNEAPNAEVLIADGGSRDDPARVAEAHGGQIVRTGPGRGTQLNAGAGQAHGDVLWFVHADTRIPAGAVAAISDALADPDVVGGAFRFRLATRHVYAGVLERAINLRSRYLRMPYGDQGLFVRSEVFHRIGGFRPMPILEDVDFVRRLRREGNLALLSPPVEVSARRWEREGFVRTTLRNQFLLAAHAVGVPATRLARWYRPEREASPR